MKILWQIIFIKTLLRIDNLQCLSCQTYQRFLETWNSASPIWTHTRNYCVTRRVLTEKVRFILDHMICWWTI